MLPSMRRPRVKPLVSLSMAKAPPRRRTPVVVNPPGGPQTSNPRRPSIRGDGVSPSRTSCNNSCRTVGANHSLCKTVPKGTRQHLEWLATRVCARRGASEPFRLLQVPRPVACHARHSATARSLTCERPRRCRRVYCVRLHFQIAAGTSVRGRSSAASEASTRPIGPRPVAPRSGRLC